MAKQDGPDAKEPLKITSREMVTDKKSGTIIFSGDVVAVKGTLTIKTDQMTVYTGKNQREFKKITAKGSVRISRDDKVATGDEAEYFNESQPGGGEERIEMTGNASLKDGKNIASGEKVVYFFKSEDMNISGGQDHPSAITFFPEDDKSPQNAPEPEKESPAPHKPAPQVQERRAPSGGGESVGHKYLIQVSASQKKRDAQHLAAKLSSKGYHPRIEEAMVKGVKWYRVRLGDYDSPDEAEKVAQRLRGQMGIQPMVQKSE